ncbi:hypothetical protein J2S74_002964 [Evansella vedderi]|uniref:Uncharacterized protein n=1 Tax=Evansella vedderi TaxID=38282 RepID=A0ABT9ZXY7_9BACI|nr:hypothetical protein [Evansella vedderi]MDQ0255582.1 hypothetical protein [Evansella vedderi]
MKPVYEKSTGYVIIEWYEKRKDASPIRHYFSAQPIKLQFHPRDEKQIVRAVFEEQMPGWLEKYAKEHDFDCHQVTKDGHVGFWIANWRLYPSNERPIPCPNINGAVEQLSSTVIPDECEELQDLVLEKMDVVKKNLGHYPSAFEPLGLYFKPEEINGKEAVMLVEDIVPERGETSDEEYLSIIQKDGRLETLIHEITTPLPEPPQEDEEEELEELEEEEVIEEELELDISFDDEVDEEEFEVTFDDESEEEEELVVTFEDEEDEGISEESFDTDSEQETLTDEDEDVTVEPIDSFQADSESTSEDVEVQETIDESIEEPSEEPSEEPTEQAVKQERKVKEETTYKVLEHADKKSKATEGQMSLF